MNEYTQLKQNYEDKIKEFEENIIDYKKQIEELNKVKNNTNNNTNNVYIPKNNKIKQKENKDANNKDNNLLSLKILDLEKELSNQKLKNEELIKDISAFNSEKQDFITQIKNLQNELNKCVENPNNDNDNKIINNENIMENNHEEKPKISETEDLEFFKKENMNLKIQIEALNQNIKELNHELDSYEKEALESEQEVNILKETNNNLISQRDQLMKEIEEFKKNTNNIQINDENKINETKDKINDVLENNKLFTQKLKNFANKVLFKNKSKLYINMLATHKMENLIIENTKLSNDKMELNQKVEILTYLINNPESISKFVDENGNISIPYDICEEMNNDNENLNNMNGEEGENNLQNNNENNS
jgi:chromosome segregation ATPase